MFKAPNNSHLKHSRLWVHPAREQSLKILIIHIQNAWWVQVKIDICVYRGLWNIGTVYSTGKYVKNSHSMHFFFYPFCQRIFFVLIFSKFVETYPEFYFCCECSNNNLPWKLFFEDTSIQKTDLCADLALFLKLSSFATSKLCGIFLMYLLKESIKKIFVLK